MKAKKVYESLNFKRGQIPSNSLNIGGSRKIVNPMVHDILGLDSGFYIVESNYDPAWSKVEIDNDDNGFLFIQPDKWKYYKKDLAGVIIGEKVHMEYYSHEIEDYLETYGVVSIQKIENNNYDEI